MASTDPTATAAFGPLRCRSKACGHGNRCDRWRWHTTPHVADGRWGRDEWGNR